VIEFQKRGLPHAHIMIIMEVEYKPRPTDDYDIIVQAEIPDKKLHPKAYFFDDIFGHFLRLLNRKHTEIKKCLELDRERKQIQI